MKNKSSNRALTTPTTYNVSWRELAIGESRVGTCPIAEALRVKYPDAVYIDVQREEIKLSLPSHVSTDCPDGTRYVFATPDNARDFLVNVDDINQAFSEGNTAQAHKLRRRMKPFAFVLSEPRIVPMGYKANHRAGWVKPPVKPAIGTRRATRKIRVNGVCRLVPVQD